MLFAQTSSDFPLNWAVLFPVVMGFLSIWYLLPTPRPRQTVFGVLGGIVALIGFGVFLASGLDRALPIRAEGFLFACFSLMAIGFAGMMITQRNPARAAMCFALVVLNVCGLFLLLAAPFLMAATIIIYAGAIVVTFLFVIMLAQQEGASNADQRSREPFLATLAGCVLLGSLLCVLQKSYHPADVNVIIRDLTQLSEASSIDDIKRVLGDPDLKKEDRTLVLVEQLKTQFATVPEDHKVHNRIANIALDWVHLREDKIKENSKAVLEELQVQRGKQGSLALRDVPGKAKTPGHFVPGKLPASNVSALGKTLFTDYLIPVELAATLLLVATIGAIAIAARRSEELR